VESHQSLLSLNISAAFDVLDHTRLLKRAATEVFGLTDQVINWLKSYLTDRSNYVSLGKRLRLPLLVALQECR